ncbi:MAG: glycoside hydrolase family 15 protein, partial [Candidatus Xenobia bacterium]
MEPAKQLEQPPRYPPIGDYAIIGDCGSVALISRHGSLDWLCLPRVDSPSMFAAILDAQRGGSFRISPQAVASVARHYLDETNVLETTFTTARGVLRLIDFMPVDHDEVKQAQLWPRRRVVRLLECVAGEVDVEVLYAPRPHYASVMPRLEDRGPLGFFCCHRDEVLVLCSEIPLHLLDDRTGAHGCETLREGDRRALAMNFDQGPALIPVPERGWHALERTLAWWREWAAHCRYDGPYRRQVMRSALALKLLTYAPSGAIVAAPTMALPERIGGVRNWDYRYCWLRDASMTLAALVYLGYAVEGQANLSWLLHPDRLTRNRLQVLYTVHGDWDVPEQELPHLDGYRGS